MINEIKANVLYLMYDLRYSLTVFWAVLVASVIGFFSLALLVNNSHIGVSINFVIYIFCGISGFLITKETFPYLIKLGSTRNMYVTSAVIFHAVLAIFMSSMATLLIQIIKFLKLQGNVENLQLFNVLNGTTFAVTWFNELWFNSIVCFFILGVGALFGSLFYRFGLIGGISGFGLTVFIMIIPQTRSWLVDHFFTLDGQLFDINMYTIMFVSVVVTIPYWLLLRKASTTAGVTR